MTEYADGQKAVASRREFDRLTAASKGAICDTCLSRVWPAWNGQAWQLRCLEGFKPDTVQQNVQLARREGMNMQRYNQDLPAVMNEGGAIGVMPDQKPMTIEEFDQRQGLIRHVVDAMVGGTHYGVIPGTKDNSLWEPGAEYLRAAFNISWGYDIIEEREDFVTHDYYYRFFVFQQLGPGVRGPGWEASAWSKERKFFCSNQRCSRDCTQDHPPRGMEASMLSHNVRDRALKRGFVAMIRNVTGTTGWFKQALDNEPDNLSQDVPVGDGTDHPLLQMCPAHNKKWMKSGKMREPGHPPAEKSGEFCNQSTVLKPILDEMLKKATDTWEQRDITPYLKENFGGTWSALSPRRKLEAITAINGLIEGSSKTEGQAPPDVDPDTGEFKQPAMEGMTEPGETH